MQSRFEQKIFFWVWIWSFGWLNIDFEIKIIRLQMADRITNLQTYADELERRREMWSVLWNEWNSRYVYVYTCYICQTSGRLERNVIKWLIGKHRAGRIATIELWKLESVDKRSFFFFSVTAFCGFEVLQFWRFFFLFWV